jgi:hypothetical protein
LPVPVPPLSNLKIWIPEVEVVVPLELYAKVVEVADLRRHTGS